MNNDVTKPITPTQTAMSYQFDCSISIPPIAKATPKPNPTQLDICKPLDVAGSLAI